jgi:hypothetical protein
MKISGDFETREVYINGKWLDPSPSQEVWNHSDAFNWGYGGSGPAQLALAILLRFTDEQTAVTLHQAFKWEHIATLPQGDFETEIDVQKWLSEHTKALVKKGAWFRWTPHKEVKKTNWRRIVIAILAITALCLVCVLIVAIQRL